MQSSRFSRYVLLSFGVGWAIGVIAAEPLPVPCAACGAGAVPFAARGVAETSVSGNTLTVNQHPERAVLNWQSFNVGPNAAVKFQQPSTKSIALNRIFQADPSQIRGQLTANGQIYLLNQNGILFGQGAQVNVNTLVASSLDIDDAVFANEGIVGAINNGNKPALAGTGTRGAVTVENGATLKTAEGGRILLVAPSVENSGTLAAPGGQVIAAAAKDKAYLAVAEGDPNLRGLLVEVETGGTVTNSGTVSTPRGNTTLVGLAVNQNGIVRATTSLNVNGSIHLLARDKVSSFIKNSSGTVTPLAAHTGSLLVGQDSLTEVALDLTPDTAVDAQAQPRSVINLNANRIQIKSRANIAAPGGNVRIAAQSNPTEPTTGTPAAELSVEFGAHISTAGTTNTHVAASRNVIEVELRGNELRDSPLQKNGLLRSKKVAIDVRKGTPLADVAPAIAALKRPLSERLAVGGDTELRSDGTLHIDSGATLDVSGGQIAYDSGAVKTTKLLSHGVVYDIANADPSRIYDGIFGQATVTHAKWGVREQFDLMEPGATAEFEPGYIEGKDAGALTLAALDLRIDGNLLGTSVRGPRQRKGASATAGFARAFDEVPLGGKLSLDLLSDVTVQSGLTGAATRQSELARSLFEFSPELLSRGSFTRSTVSTTGEIAIPAGTQLTLAPGGELALSGGRVTIAGTVSAPGGKITLRSAPNADFGNRDTSITLAPSAKLDVKGQWINDRATRNQDPQADLGATFSNGGTVDLKAVGDLTLTRSSLIDVSGGGQLTLTGAFKPGKAGTLNLASDDAFPTRLSIEGDLRGFAFARGGSLTVTAGGFEVSTASGDTLTHLSPLLFSELGFANFTFNAVRTGISIAPNTAILASMLNRLPNPDFKTTPTGTDIDALTHIGKLDDATRLPVSLSFNYQRRVGVDDRSHGVELSQGAHIDADPGAKIFIASDTKLRIDGRITAPAGSIALTLQKPLTANDSAGYDPDQSLALGPDSALLAGATTVLTPNSLGLRKGSVLSGGTVSLVAQRGYLIAQHGSTIDVSGTTSTLDLLNPASPLSRTPTAVSAHGGVINLTAAEGMVLNGDFRGRLGGRLALTLDTADRATSIDPNSLITPFPEGPRSLVVSEQPVDDIVPNAPIDPRVNGIARIAPSRIAAGEFDALSLRVRPVAADQTASIVFEGGTLLRPPQAVRLDAPIIEVTDGAVEIVSSYVQLGPLASGKDSSRSTLSPTTGSGVFNVTASHIDLMGDLSLRGIGTASLVSRGDIRLIGSRLPPSSSNEFKGSLSLDGTLLLDAARLYPATLTDYVISNTGGDITFATHTPDRSIPLSAGARLKVVAANIQQGGVIQAPFGHLDFSATDTLNLTAGSITSTTGADTLIPFGQIQLGTEWTFGLGNGVTRVIDKTPDKQINLSGSAITFASGAVLDVRGGGDLFAFEHIPGPGGSTDILSGDNAPGAFAIIPTLGNQFAPFDPTESPLAGFDPAQTITLTGVPGLAPGTYAMLPARYAMLPNALLLTPIAKSDNIVAAPVDQMKDGFPVAAGRIGSADLGATYGVWRGYRVESATDLKPRVEYNVKFASEFFPAKAAAAGVTNALFARDAGSLSFNAERALDLSGKLLSLPSTNGQGATVDIIADHLAVVPALTGKPQRVELLARDLTHLGAASLVLGGRRTATSDGFSIEVRAHDVTLDAGAELSAPEAVLTAREQVSVAHDAILATMGPATKAPRKITLAGDSAVLSVSQANQTTIARSAPRGAQGTVSIATGARVAAAGSIALDGSRDAIVGGTLNSNHGAVWLASSKISIGDAPENTPGIVLSTTQLGELEARDLFLNSQSTIDLFGNLKLAFENVTVNAAGLGGHRDPKNGANTAGEVVTISAQRLALSNTAKVAGPDLSTLPTTLHAALALQVQDLEFGDGAFSIGGFDAVHLAATRGAHFGAAVNSGTSAPLIKAPATQFSSTGKLSLDAPVITGGTAGVLTLTAPSIRLAQPLQATAANTPLDLGLGAKLEVTAQAIDFGGHVALPSGTLKLHATGPGGILLDDRALIDLAGTSQIFGDRILHTAGGDFSAIADTGAVVILGQTTGVNGKLLQPGSLIDVSSRGGASAGSVSLYSPRGKLTIGSTARFRGFADNPAEGGRIAIDTAKFGGTTFAELNASLTSAGLGRFAIDASDPSGTSLEQINAALKSIGRDPSTFDTGKLAADLIAELKKAGLDAFAINHSELIGPVPAAVNESLRNAGPRAFAIDAANPAATSLADINATLASVGLVPIVIDTGASLLADINDTLHDAGLIALEFEPSEVAGLSLAKLFANLKEAGLKPVAVKASGDALTAANATLRRAGSRLFAVDGAHPSATALSEINAALRGAGLATFAVDVNNAAGTLLTEINTTFRSTQRRTFVIDAAAAGQTATTDVNASLRQFSLRTFAVDANHAAATPLAEVNATLARAALAPITLDLGTTVVADVNAILTNAGLPLVTLDAGERAALPLPAFVAKLKAAGLDPVVINASTTPLAEINGVLRNSGHPYFVIDGTNPLATPLTEINATLESAGLALLELAIKPPSVADISATLHQVSLTSLVIDAVKASAAELSAGLTTAGLTPIALNRSELSFAQVSQILQGAGLNTVAINVAGPTLADVNSTLTTAGLRPVTIDPSGTSLVGLINTLKDAGLNPIAVDRNGASLATVNATLRNASQRTFVLDAANPGAVSVTELNASLRHASLRSFALDAANPSSTTLAEVNATLISAGLDPIVLDTGANTLSTVNAILTAARLRPATIDSGASAGLALPDFVASLKRAGLDPIALTPSGTTRSAINAQLARRSVTNFAINAADPASTSLMEVNASLRAANLRSLALDKANPAATSLTDVNAAFQKARLPSFVLDATKPSEIALAAVNTTLSNAGLAQIEVDFTGLSLAEVTATLTDAGLRPLAIDLSQISLPDLTVRLTDAGLRPVAINRAPLSFAEASATLKNAGLNSLILAPAPPSLATINAGLRGAVDHTFALDSINPTATSLAAINSTLKNAGLAPLTRDPVGTVLAEINATLNAAGLSSVASDPVTTPLTEYLSTLGAAGLNPIAINPTGASVADFNARLNASGFSAARTFRLRTGDLALDQTSVIAANDISLAVDAGSLVVGGTLDASGAAPGTVGLSARDNLTLSGYARIDAHATGVNQAGGKVRLETRAGALNLDAGALVDVRGTGATVDNNGRVVAADTGYVHLRAPRIKRNPTDVDAADLSIGTLSAAINGAERVDLEGFRAVTAQSISATARTTPVDRNLRLDRVNPLRNLKLTDTLRVLNINDAVSTDAEFFMAGAAGIKTRLNLGNAPRFHVIPGIEVQSPGNLTILSDLDLFGARPGGEVGALTLRAAGDLKVNGTISDGIKSVSLEIAPDTGEFLRPRDTVQTGPSWSYRLAAGADLASSDPLAVTRGAGDLVLAEGRSIRTGVRDIEIKTGRDLRLSGAGAAIYTMGENRGAGSFSPLFTEVLLGADYLTHGGNVLIEAHGDIRGPVANVIPSFISRMFGPITSVGDTPFDAPLGWGIDVASFVDGIGALAGGRVSIRAEGNLDQVPVVIPTTGQPTADGTVSVTGGGRLDVAVDGDIRSGYFLIERGAAQLRAGGGVVKAPNVDLGSVLEVGDANVEVQARTGIQLATAFNPTLSPFNTAQGLGEQPPVYFNTYSDRSTISLQSLSGDIVFDNKPTSVSFDLQVLAALTLYPGSLHAHALGGSIVINNPLILFPAPRGQLELLAANDVRSADKKIQIRLLDTDPLMFPSMAAPSGSVGALSELMTSDKLGIGHAASPVHAGDSEPVRIIAKQGFLGAGSTDARVEIGLAKQAFLSAGGDITNVSLKIQHVNPGDHSVVQAGRDIVFPTPRTQTGALQPSLLDFEFSGPGNFDVLAGRDVNLGASNGIGSVGNLKNPALPNGKGNITVGAGFADPPDLAGFIARYLTTPTDSKLATAERTEQNKQYQERVAHLEKFLADFKVDANKTPLENLRALPEAAQRQYVISEFFTELKQSGIAAAKSATPATAYKRGFDAINVLFPRGQATGDISSLLSRIAALDDGDLTLLAPHGLVNAGSAAATGLEKKTDKLGIVTQRLGDIFMFVDGDIQINRSREFVLDGGSILDWSSHGNIDAGRGAKTALSIPPPITTFDADGNATTEFPPAVSGSGIQAAVSTPGLAPGDVFLFAPEGVVDAGDAGIVSAGNLTIAATAVLGADNISVGGVATGVSTASVSVPVGLAGASAAAGSAAKSATDTAANSVKNKDTVAKNLAQSLVSVISVEFLGFGQ